MHAGSLYATWHGEFFFTEKGERAARSVTGEERGRRRESEGVEVLDDEIEASERQAAAEAAATTENAKSSFITEKNLKKKKKNK